MADRLPVLLGCNEVPQSPSGIMPEKTKQITRRFFHPLKAVTSPSIPYVISGDHMGNLHLPTYGTASLLVEANWRTGDSGLLPLHISNGITLIKVLMDTSRGAVIYEKPLPCISVQTNGEPRPLSLIRQVQGIILYPSPTVGGMVSKEIR